MDRPLKHWINAYDITAEERAQLADGAGMSLNYLSQLVNGHRPISVEAAARLEAASLALSRVRAGAAPVLARGELCQVCAECPHHPARKEQAA